MMKRIVKQKQATFTLEEDGFSIHTFEVFQQLTGIEFRRIKAELYDICQKGAIHKMKNLPAHLRFSP